MLMLSHFKGHAMGGFGGALKNMSIGLASSRGKIWIHTSASSERFEDVFTDVYKRQAFKKNLEPKSPTLWT